MVRNQGWVDKLPQMLESRDNDGDGIGDGRMMTMIMTGFLIDEKQIGTNLITPIATKMV